MGAPEGDTTYEAPVDSIGNLVAQLSIAAESVREMPDIFRIIRQSPLRRWQRVLMLVFSVLNIYWGKKPFEIVLQISNVFLFMSLFSFVSQRVTSDHTLLYKK